MKKGIKNCVLFLIFFIFITVSFIALGQSQPVDETQTQMGWSSVDDVFIKPEADILLKKPISGPIKIGFTAKEVREVMGIPHQIDEEEHVYYYRTSPIYFNEEWEVQSWDNRYGNLDVQPEIVKIGLGSHILDVFKQKDFPLRIKKMDSGYQLEYPEELIFIGEGWRVESIQAVKEIEYRQMERETMTLNEFLKEFENFISE